MLAIDTNPDFGTLGHEEPIPEEVSAHRLTATGAWAAAVTAAQGRDLARAPRGRPLFHRPGDWTPGGAVERNRLQTHQVWALLGAGDANGPAAAFANDTKAGCHEPKGRAIELAAPDPYLQEVWTAARRARQASEPESDRHSVPYTAC